MATTQVTEIQGSLVNCPVKLSKLVRVMLKTYMDIEGIDSDAQMIFVDGSHSFTKSLILFSIGMDKTMTLYLRRPEYRVDGEPIYYVRLKDFKLKCKDD
jgi:hypothetical protein